MIEQAATPDAITLETIVSAARDLMLHDLANELGDRKNRRAVPHKMERAGYVPVRNPTPTTGCSRSAGRRQVVYAKRTLDHCRPDTRGTSRDRNDTDMSAVSAGQLSQ